MNIVQLVSNHFLLYLKTLPLPSSLLLLLLELLIQQHILKKIKTVVSLIEIIYTTYFYFYFHVSLFLLGYQFTILKRQRNNFYYHYYNIDAATIPCIWKLFLPLISHLVGFLLGRLAELCRGPQVKLLLQQSPSECCHSSIKRKKVNWFQVPIKSKRNTMLMLQMFIN